MKVLQLAGAAALCGALLLTACAKKTDQSTTSSTDNTATSQSAGATPAADAAASTAPAGDATTAPASDASPAAVATTASSVSASSSSGNGASSGYIDLPVYPGAAENKDQDLSSSSNGVSVTMTSYTTKDDAKRVADWYKSHLPSSWKNGILTYNGKTSGAFSNEHADGDQSVLITSADDSGTTRIQLTTKHGK
jgi:hypothetical protein